MGRNLQVRDAVLGQALELRKWDRLEIGSCVEDIHCTIQNFAGPGPFQLDFWRASDNGLAFLSHIMLIPGAKHEHIVVDDLHTLDLGVAARFAAAVFLRALKTDIFGNRLTKEGLMQGCKTLTRRFAMWGKANKSRYFKISLKGLCYVKTTSKGQLRAKGAACRAAMHFAYSLMTKPNVVKMGKAGEGLRRAAKALCKAYALMEASDLRMDHRHLGNLLDRVSKYSKGSGVGMIPKFHLARHMAKCARLAGNPRLHSAYG
jgi:hypothetical protein